MLIFIGVLIKDLQRPVYLASQNPICQPLCAASKAESSNQPDLTRDFTEIFVSLAVIHQRYDLEVQNPGGFIGSNVIIKCNIPQFVKEYVKVTSWLEEPMHNIYPSAEGGEFEKKSLNVRIGILRGMLAMGKVFAAKSTNLKASLGRLKARRTLTSCESCNSNCCFQPRKHSNGKTSTTRST